jgi:hypothetical protein
MMKSIGQIFAAGGLGYMVVESLFSIFGSSPMTASDATLVGVTAIVLGVAMNSGTPPGPSQKPVGRLRDLAVA